MAERADTGCLNPQPSLLDQDTLARSAANDIRAAEGAIYGVLLSLPIWAVVVWLAV